MRLDYQRPQSGQIPVNANEATSGRKEIEFRPDDAIIMASVGRNKVGPKLYASIFFETDKGDFRFNPKSDYIWSTGSSLIKDVTWEGFFYPKTNFKLIFETGKTNVAWDDDEIKFFYQSVVVIE